MFEHLRDPHPPAAGPAQRAAVTARATRLRRRARVRQSVLAFAAVVVVAVGVVMVGHRSSTSSVDVLNPTGTCCGAIAGVVTGDQAGRNGVTVFLLYPDDGRVPGTAPSGAPDAANPWRIKTQQMTDVSGHYRFDHLEPGRYVLRFTEPFDELKAKVLYEPAFYDGASVLSKATPVEVTTGATATVDVTLRRSANWGIKGQVQLAGVPNPFPVARITVRLFVDGELTRETVTDKDGNYDLGGVEPGSYRVAFVDASKGIYATTWANDGRPLSMGGDADLIVNASVVSCPGPNPDHPLDGCD